MVVILASAMLAYQLPGRRLAILLIAVAPALVAISILVRRPGLGVAMLVVSGLIVPASFGTGTGTSLNPVVLLIPLLTGLWLLDSALRQHAIRLHRHSSVYFILALCLVVTLSFLAGQLSWFDIPGAGLAPQIGGLFVFLFSAAAFLLAAHTLDEPLIKLIVKLFLTIGIALIVARLFPPLSPLLRLFTSGSLGSVFWIFLAAFPAAITLFYTELDVKWRVATGVLATTTLLIGYIQGGYWASGWAPPFVALLLLLWLRFPRWGVVPVLAVVLIFIARFDQFWLLVTNNESWLARRQAWQIVLDTVRVNPIFGLGPSNYYFYVRQASIAGWGGLWNVEFSSHNNWVDLIAQAGILGLGLFIAFSVSISRVGVKLFRAQSGGFTQAYAAACLTGLVATLASGMLGDWFLPFVYNVGLEGLRSSILFWVFMGGLLSLFMNFAPGSSAGKREA